MKELFFKKNYQLSDINLILILILPISLLAGSLVSNLLIVILCILYLVDLYINKNNYLYRDKNFLFLLIIYLYLIFNSFWISENPESILKAFSFLRFIILAYAINYYFKRFDKEIIKFWSLIFLIVSIDIIIEIVFGKNILGYSSDYPGRIASFTDDELKIGGFYFGFIFICLSFFHKKRFWFILVFFIFLFISLLIGERSNFLKIFIMYFLYMLFFIDYSWKKKIIFLLISFLSISMIILSNKKLTTKYFYQIFQKKNQIEISASSKFYHFPYKLKESRYFDHYNLAIKIFNQNKIFGTGFKDFRLDSFKDVENLNKVGSTHPHQIHFEILCELGLVGYFLIMINMIMIILKNIRLKEKLFVRNGAILFLIATFFPFLPSGSFFTSYGATIFFINYAFLIKYGYNNDNLKI